MSSMEQLIAKSELLDCSLSDMSALLLMGKSAYFECYDDGYVGVLTKSASRLPFGFGASKTVWIGYLVPELAEILYLAIKSDAQFRVRIIEVTPSYASTTGRTEVYVSIWGFSDDLKQYDLIDSIKTR
jgi:hypothetical protein